MEYAKNAVDTIEESIKNSNIGMKYTLYIMSPHFCSEIAPQIMTIVEVMSIGDDKEITTATGNKTLEWWKKFA
jgi:hypothetical protein